MKSHYQSRVFKVLPSRFTGIMLFGACFFRNNMESVTATVQEEHEQIHAAQYINWTIIGLVLLLLIAAVVGLSNGPLHWLLWAIPVPFLLYYIIYGVEFLVNRFRYKSMQAAYKNITFEKEAFINETQTGYHFKLLFDLISTVLAWKEYGNDIWDEDIKRYILK